MKSTGKGAGRLIFLHRVTRSPAQKHSTTLNRYAFCGRGKEVAHIEAHTFVVGDGVADGGDGVS